MISQSLNREADEGCKKPLERLLNIWQERSVYGSEFIQQLKLSMEDSNSPQTKGKCILLVVCVLFLNWCMFQWNYCEELSCCQSWLWRFFRTVLRSVIFIKPSVLVCWWAVLGLAVSLTGCDIWCCLCRFSAPGLPFGVKASQSCRELMCPPQVKCPTLHLWDCSAGLLECLIQYCQCFHSHINCFVFHSCCILLWWRKEFWIIEVWNVCPRSLSGLLFSYIVSRHLEKTNFA